MEADCDDPNMNKEDEKILAPLEETTLVSDLMARDAMITLQDYYNKQQVKNGISFIVRLLEGKLRNMRLGRAKTTPSPKKINIITNKKKYINAYLCMLLLLLLRVCVFFLISRIFSITELCRWWGYKLSQGRGSYRLRLRVPMLIL